METAYIMEFFLPRLWTFLTAMTPVGELRAAIPLGLGKFGLGVIETYIIAVIGNMVPVVAILWILEPISRFPDEKVQLGQQVLYLAF